MKMKTLLFLCLSSLPLSSLAIEDVTVAYTYEGNHGVDLSSMRFTLEIPHTTDDRSSDNPRLITSTDLGNDVANGGYQAESNLTSIVQDALEQGFTKGNAKIVDNEGEMRLASKILNSEATLVDRGGVESIQLTMRINIQLQGNGRTIWQTTLFGRGVVPTNEGMGAAVRAGLNRMIGELIMDDYFLAEIL